MHVTNFPKIMQSHLKTLPTKMLKTFSPYQSNFCSTQQQQQQQQQQPQPLIPHPRHRTAMSSVNPTTSTTKSKSKKCQPPPCQLLEITVISAQDLSPVAKSMKTYAIVWLSPDHKQTTRVDSNGNANPTWNDKFVFKVDDNLLTSDTTAVIVEIYTVSWIRDNLVGTVRVLITNLLPPNYRTVNDSATRFVALQVRRASGSPQGILNMGVSLVDSTMRSMPLSVIENKDAAAEPDEELNTKIELWRSRSERTDLTSEDNYYPQKEVGGSICNGSMVNGGSELCSDVGPSASIVAAAIAKGLYPPPPPQTATAGKGFVLKPDMDDGGSSILEDLTMEEAMAKGYKWKAERERERAAARGGKLPPARKQDEKAVTVADGRHSRRLSDGSLFSCFVYGLEFTIVCGANQNPKSKNNRSNNNSSSGGEKPIKRSHSHLSL